ncbi:MAG: metallophosphoesterase [Terracidiphilus sp.]
MLAGLLLLASAALAQIAQPGAARGKSAPLDAVPSALQGALSGRTVPALLLSDIHFEPFWDTAKVSQLAAAPASAWDAILAAPASPDRERHFAALERSCPTHGSDTSFPLFASSLEAMRTTARGARFVTVSGDLISHAFACKYNVLFPHSSPQAYREFVRKSLDYVISKLYQAFPGVPVYLALGNNDSDCGDYRLDMQSGFLTAMGREITGDFPAGERSGAQRTFAAGGYYSVSLPAPIENTRLLVLDDIFLSRNYRTCAGKADPAAATVQLAWLRRQLALARTRRQNIWIMGHIPPGVDLYSTIIRLDNVCGGQRPAMFLSSEKLAEVLAGSGDVIRLAIFAHTHMDELRLLRPDGPRSASAQGVAVKMIASISPIHGNSPSFTVAEVDPVSAALVDYRVYAASNLTGAGTSWREEYDFARSFHQPLFSAPAVKKLIAGFAADPGAKTEASQRYIDDFSLGHLSPVLRAFWPQYVCLLSNDTAQDYQRCVCPANR